MELYWKREGERERARERAIGCNGGELKACEWMI